MNAPLFSVLPDYSAIDICGSDTSKFLQGQLTINIETPSEQKSCLAAVCNPKGRVVSLFHIVTIPDGVRIILPTSLVEQTQSHLSKYAVFFKVSISTCENLQLVGGHNLPDTTITSLVNANFRLYQANEHPLWFIELGAKDSIEAIAKSAEIDFTDDPNYWFECLASHKICWLSEKTSGEYLPHNLDLPQLQAVDFNKGCFTGQEVIARMHYKGKLKQHLRLLHSKLPVENGPALTQSAATCKLLQQQSSVGEVVCSSLSKQKRWIVLALVKESANFQQNFTVNFENSPILELVE